jgi:hypothetical protein
MGADQLIDGLDNALYFQAGKSLTPILPTQGDTDSTCFHSSELMADMLRGGSANFEFVP